MRSRLCDWWLRLAAPLVPSDIRREWLREWRAELVLVRGSWHALGALPHAIWLRWDRWRFEMIAQDLKYAVRSLTMKPGFAAVTLLTLGIGIGANAAIYGAVRAVLLRPLPFPDPDRVVSLSTTTIKSPQVAGGVSSVPDFLDWRRDTHSFAEMAAVVSEDSTITGDGDAEQLPNARITGGFFNVLGVQALYGRTIGLEDDAATAERVVVLGHRLWVRRFGSRPDVVGKMMTIDGLPRRIAGVLPQGFAYPLRAELYYPLRFTEKEIIGQRGAMYLDVIARLKPEATFASAQSEMRTYARLLEQQYPGNTGRTVTLFVVRDALVGSVRTAMVFLLAAVGFVLLIVCVNVANLFLTRALGRQREFAVRSALGASRGRLIRGLMVESALVAFAGGAVGLLIAVWLTALIAGLDRGLGIPLLDQTRVDASVVVFAFGISLLTAIMFGTLPAWHASSKLDLARRIREGAGNIAGDPHKQRLRSVLVVFETAMAVILLVGAGLLARSFAGLTSVPLGFAAEGVQTFSIAFPEPKYPTSVSRSTFVDTLLARSARLPQVDGVSGVFGLPLTDLSYSISFASRDGRRFTRDDGQQRPSVQVRIILPEYFTTMGIPLRRGRAIDATDRSDSALAVVINEAAAASIWPGVDPIGHEFSLGTPLGLKGPIAGGTVVGIAADVRDFGPIATPRPTVYLSYAQFPMNFLTIVMKTRDAPQAATEPARIMLKDLDPDLPMFDVRSMAELSSRIVAQPRLYLLLLTLFAGTAMLLAAIGTYGVLAHSVSQRTREIGIRLALGAHRGQVVRAIVVQATLLSSVGLLTGLAVAAATGRFIRGLLFGVQPIDPITYVAVAGSLAIVGLFASWIPARRAARIDPVTALRHE